MAADSSADPLPPAVRLADVTVTYPGPPPTHALRECELTVARGEYVAIVGPSGSGKSTLLNLIGLLDRPTSGRYELDGLDVSRLSDRDRTAVRARLVGFVFQAFHLLAHRTAEENVALALLYRGVPRAERLAIARDLLDRTGLSHRRRATPPQLSGGERQRVAIARALANSPSLLLCDEPTGNLDTAAADTVLGLIDDLRVGGLTVLMITHDPSVASRADRVVTILDGVLIGSAAQAS